MPFHVFFGLALTFAGGSSAWDGYVASITADALVKSQTSGVVEKVITGGTPDFYKK